MQTQEAQCYTLRQKQFSWEITRVITRWSSTSWQCTESKGFREIHSQALSSLHPLPSRLRNLCKGGNGKTVSARGGWQLPENRALGCVRDDACMNTHWLWHYARGLHKFKPDKIPTQKVESGHRVSCLGKKLFETDSFWEREDQFSSVE